MTSRSRVFVLLIAVGVLALSLAACGGTDFSSASPDIPAAVGAAGGEVTAEGTAPNLHAGGREATWYTVSRPGSSVEGLLVSVLPFDSREARDAAFSRIRYGMRRLATTVVYAYGDSAVVISQIRDWGLLEDLDDALEEAGA